MQNFNNLQKSTHYRVTWEILQKIKSIRTTLIACAVCILMTYLATSYVMYQYGSKVLWNGDSVIGLREQIVDLKNSCESSKKLNEAELKIAALESENEQLANQANHDIFLHLRNVSQMTLKERAELRSNYAQWEELREESEAKENKFMFEQIISELPDETRAQWDHFQAQLKKDEEGTLWFIKNQPKKHKINHTEK